MEALLWIVAAYLFVAVLTFIGLCRRLLPLDTIALLIVVWMSLIWPVTISGVVK